MEKGQKIRSSPTPGREPPVEKPLSLHYASLAIALGMVMTVIALWLNYLMYATTASDFLATNVGLFLVVIGTIRYAVDLERGRPGVRKKLVASVALQLMFIASTTYLGYGNQLFGYAAAIDLIAVALLYYPRTSYWLKHVRRADEQS